MRLLSRPTPAAPSGPTTDGHANWAQVPRQGIAQSKVRRRAKWMARGVLICAPLALLLSLLGLGGGTAELGPGDGLSFRGVAEVAANDFLAGRKVQIPVSEGLDPAFGRSAAAAEGSSATGAERPKPIEVSSLAWRGGERQVAGESTYEVHTFVARTRTGGFEVSVTVADGGGGPVLAALPSVTPLRVGVPSQENPLAWDEVYGSGALTPGGTQQVLAWAKAYAADDRRALYQLTGDTRAAEYPGLGGFEMAGDPLALSVGAVKEGLLVKLRLPMRLVSDPETLVTADYDLLVSGLDQALPTVVAWGPAGRGPNLVQFENAVVAPPGATTPSSSTSTTVAG